MSELQPQSKPIRKRSKNNPNEVKNFVCGACLNPYKFYPSLYLHIKRKHGGIRPPGTKIQKPVRQPIGQSGRPKKAQKDIDDLSEDKVDLEAAQNDLMELMGERLAITRDMGPKPSLKDIVRKILEICGDHIDKWFRDIQEGSQEFLEEYQEKEKDIKILNLDFEEFMKLDSSQSLNIIVWFIMWLGQIYVKMESLPDLCFVLSKVWKVMDETGIEAYDLDNKLIWKKIMKECEGSLAVLFIFKNDFGLLDEFIKRVCKLVGKSFEERLE